MEWFNHWFMEWFLMPEIAAELKSLLDVCLSVCLEYYFFFFTGIINWQRGYRHVVLSLLDFVIPKSLSSVLLAAQDFGMPKWRLMIGEHHNPSWTFTVNPFLLCSLPHTSSHLFLSPFLHSTSLVWCKYCTSVCKTERGNCSRGIKKLCPALDTWFCSLLPCTSMQGNRV